MQFFLGADVPVERHRAHVEFAGDPPHADRLGALVIGDGDRRGDDVRHLEAAGSPPRLPPVFPVPGHVIGDLPLATKFMPVAAVAEDIAENRPQWHEEVFFRVLVHGSLLAAAGKRSCFSYTVLLAYGVRE